MMTESAHSRTRGSSENLEIQKMLLFFYMLSFFEPSLEPLGKLGFSTILEDSSSSWRERVSGHYNGRKVKGHWN